MKKNKILLISLAIILWASSMLLAEDYPSNFIGPGYREYLYGKIQDGYYVDAFAKMDVGLKTKIDKRNQIEDILNNSYRARPETNYSILSAEYDKRVNEQETVRDIIKTRQQREQGAAAQGEFYYIPYADGKREYFKDGLLWRIENELVKDQFGNESRKNTYNIKYNDKRLMIGYESSSTNLFGDTTYNLFECDYTEDSVYYGTNDSVANKLMSRYRITEIDASGHKNVISWTADGYVGKFLTGSREITDSEVYGHSEVHRYNIVYAGGDPQKPTSYMEDGVKWGNDVPPEKPYTWHVERSNIKYLDLVGEGGGNNPLAVSWHEIYKDSDGNYKEQDVENEYYVNGNQAVLLSTTSTYTSRDISGTMTQGRNKVTYTYDEKGALESATGTGEYTSTDVDGTTTTTSVISDTYEVIHGRAKLVNSHTHDKIVSPGGTTTKEHNQDFTYDQWGLYLVDAQGMTIGQTVGPGGDISYFYAIESYSIILGEAKLTNVTTTTYTYNIYNEKIPGQLSFADLKNSELLEEYRSGADSCSISTKTFEYDANGRLTGASGVTDTHSVTKTGDVTDTHMEEEYEIYANQAFLTDQTIHTTGSNLSGDTWEELERVHYTYGEYSSSETGRNGSHNLLGVNQAEVTLNGVTATGRITISHGMFTDDEGNPTSTTTTITQNTYEVRYGQSYITQSVATSNTENLVRGSYTTRVQTTSYTYGWIEYRGTQYFVATSQDVSITSEGHDISGNSWHSITPETYTLNFQLCTYNGKEYWGIPEGTKIETSYTISGRDQYKHVYNETITNKYEYKYGQPWLTESTSVRDTTNTDSKHEKEKSHTATTTTYTYGEITLDGKTYYGLKSYTVTTKSNGTDKDGKDWSSTEEIYTLTSQECEYNGKKYWGVPEGTKITTTYTSTNEKKEYTVTNTYEIKYGQLLLLESKSKGGGGTSTTTNTYGWITFQGKEYYAIKSQTYNFGHGISKTFELGEYALNGVTYWGLKEGGAGGGWKVENGKVNFSGGGGGGEGGDEGGGNIWKKYRWVRMSNGNLVPLSKHRSYIFERDANGGITTIRNANEARSIYASVGGTINVTGEGTTSVTPLYNKSGEVIGYSTTLQTTDGAKLTTYIMSTGTPGVYELTTQITDVHGATSVVARKTVTLQMTEEKQEDGTTEAAIVSGQAIQVELANGAMATFMTGYNYVWLAGSSAANINSFSNLSQKTVERITEPLALPEKSFTTGKTTAAGEPILAQVVNIYAAGFDAFKAIGAYQSSRQEPDFGGISPAEAGVAPQKTVIEFYTQEGETFTPLGAVDLTFTADSTQDPEGYYYSSQLQLGTDAANSIQVSSMGSAQIPAGEGGAGLQEGFEFSLTYNIPLSGNGSGASQDILPITVTFQITDGSPKMTGITYDAEKLPSDSPVAPILNNLGMAPEAVNPPAEVIPPVSLQPQPLVIAQPQIQQVSLNNPVSLVQELNDFMQNPFLWGWNELKDKYPALIGLRM